MKFNLTRYLRNNVQPKMLLFLLVSLLLLTLTATYLYLIKKPFSEYRQSQQTLSLLENELQSGLSFSSLIATANQNIAQLDTQLYGTSQLLPINQIIAHVIGELDQIADQHNVKLVSVNPGKLGDRHIFKELPFNLELAGTYLNLYEWLNDVEQSLGPIVVKQFEISPDPITEIRTMQLTMVSYRFEKDNL